MDSIFKYLQDEHQDKIGKPMEVEDWTFLAGTKIQIPRQTNGIDCGVFCCMFIKVILEFVVGGPEGNLEKPFSTGMFRCFSALDVPRIRQQMQLDVLRGTIFPY